MASDGVVTEFLKAIDYDRLTRKNVTKIWALTVAKRLFLCSKSRSRLGVIQVASMPNGGLIISGIWQKIRRSCVALFEQLNPITGVSFSEGKRSETVMYNRHKYDGI